jgi:hypothetical protein
VAITAVLTTISGAILAHVEAQRYDQVVSQYRATARRLRNAIATAPPPESFAVPSKEWSAFVVKCEGILAAENNSWLAKWSKP